MDVRNQPKGTSMPILCIYHGNCADGFTAAWAVRKRFPTADFYAATYQQDPPDVTGRTVIFVDFCYKRDMMLALREQAEAILVLDHHKSAAEDMVRDLANGILVWSPENARKWPGDPWGHFLCCTRMDVNEGLPHSLIYCLFDMDRSGAGLAWDFFHPGVLRPVLVDRVEDRDLWRFNLFGTREYQAAVFSYEYTFANWDKLAEMPLLDLCNEGHAIERKHFKDIAELVKVCQRTLDIGGHAVPVASLPYTLTSDAGHQMAHGQPFAACYWDTPTSRVFSLRSTDDGMDVSEIAKQYGGGGHKHAAGFAVPREHDLARA